MHVLQIRINEIDSCQDYKYPAPTLADTFLTYYSTFAARLATCGGLETE